MSERTRLHLRFWRSARGDGVASVPTDEALDHGQDRPSGHDADTARLPIIPDAPFTTPEFAEASPAFAMTEPDPAEVALSSAVAPEAEALRIRANAPPRSTPSHRRKANIAIPMGEKRSDPDLAPPPRRETSDSLPGNLPHTEAGPAPTGPHLITQATQAAESEEKKEETTHMSKIESAINDLLAIDGASGAAIVDISSGMALGTGGSPGFDLTVAAAGNSNVIRAKLATMTDIGINERIEDIMITLENQYHLINVLNTTDTDGLFIYLVLDRKKANLALARHKLNRISSAVSV